jgi:hypothetical protein
LDWDKSQFGDAHQNLVSHADNARPHTAKVVSDFCQANGIPLAAHLPEAPDLAPSTSLPAQSAEPSPSQPGDKGKVEVKSEPRPYYGRLYVSHTRSRFNGQDSVEEHRGKVTHSDEETQIAARRRVGD